MLLQASVSLFCKEPQRGSHDRGAVVVEDSFDCAQLGFSQPQVSFGSMRQYVKEQKGLSRWFQQTSALLFASVVF